MDNHKRGQNPWSRSADEAGVQDGDDGDAGPDSADQILENARRRTRAREAAAAAEIQAINSSVYSGAVETVAHMSDAKAKTQEELWGIRAHGSTNRHRLLGKADKDLQKIWKEQAVATNAILTEVRARDQECRATIEQVRAEAERLQAADDNKFRHQLAKIERDRREKLAEAEQRERTAVAEYEDKQAQEDLKLKSEIQAQQAGAAEILERAIEESRRIAEEERRKRAGLRAQHSEHAEQIGLMEQINQILEYSCPEVVYLCIVLPILQKLGCTKSPASTNANVQAWRPNPNIVDDSEDLD